MPHTIRLAGPWEIRVGNGPRQKIRVPFDLAELFASEDEVTLTRRFNRPANLGEETRLFLCVEGCGYPVTVRLDTNVVAERVEGAARVEIEDPLSNSPILQIAIHPCERTGHPRHFQPVRLEIVEPWDDDSWGDEAADAADAT